MTWRKCICTVGAVLLCTSVLMAEEKAKKVLPPTNVARLSSSVAQAQEAGQFSVTATKLHSLNNGPRVGGDTCDTATVIGALPYTDTGNTCSFTDDYDEVCPYEGSTSPDVVYEYTPAADITVDISLCNDGTDYDTKLYVYEGGCPGTVVACNDDACSTPQFPSAYVSETAGVSLVAGTTYYIIVDGYGDNCGNYTLSVNEATPPPPGPECPEGSLFSQPPTSPEAGWIAGTSEANVNGTNYVRAENFSGVTGQICDIHWWGLNLVNTGAWTPCTDSNPQFEIKFYQDNGGEPGAEACSYLVTPVQVPTGLLYAGFELYYYSVESLSPCCTLADGWVSIQGLGDADCWFLWMSYGENGAGNSYLWTDGAGAFEAFDLSLCLTGEYIPTFGACCDDSTGDCQENVEMINCIGPNMRFIEDGTCDMFDPPCGVIPGACCFEYPNCEIMTEADCTAAGGDWLGPNTDCSQCPIDCPPGSIEEQEPCGDDTNGGCNMATPTFEPLACNTTVCGTGWFDGSTRDTDWYEIVITETTQLTLTVTPDFDALAGFLGQTIPGVPGCDNITGSVDPAMFPVAGETQSVTMCVGPGTYYAFCAPLFGDIVECPAMYLMTLDCEPCTIPTGACCLPDTSCIDDLTADECAAQGGVYQGDGTQCADIECPEIAAADFCEDAVLVDVPSSTLGSTADATVDDQFFACDTSITAPGVWFSVIGTGNTITATTCGDFFEYDTKITAYCGGCSTEEWACIAGNDDDCANGASGLLSTVSWCSAAGEEYLILVHGFSSNSGQFVLDVYDDGVACSNPPECAEPMGACCVETDCIGDMFQAECEAQGGDWYAGQSCETFQCPEPLANDECADAICVEDGVSVAGTNIDSTGTDISSCASNDFTDVWYMYTPTVSEDVTVSLCANADFDTTLAIYSDCSGAGSELACNDDSCGVQSEITMPMTAGTTYYIRVAGYNGAMGNFILDVTGGSGTCGCGDLDGDGDVDVDDYWAFIDAFGTCDGDPKYNAAADFDGDGCITLVDYQMWVQCYRDANPGQPLLFLRHRVTGSTHRAGSVGSSGAMRLP